MLITMEYPISSMRMDLYHFAGYTPQDLYETTNEEIKSLWNEHFNKH